MSKYLKNTISIPEDLFSASDYREAEHIASCYEDQLFEKIINRKRIRFLSTWGGETYAKFFIGKQIIKQARLVFLSFRYAEKVSRTYKLRNTIYIWPEMFSWKIYTIIRSMRLLPEHIKLHPLSVIYLRSYSLLKYLYFFLKSLLYPEIIFLKTKNTQKTISKIQLNACAYLEQSIIHERITVNEIVKDKIFKLFPKKDVVFIDELEKNSQLVNIIKKAGYKALRLEETTKSISKLQYFKDYYCSDALWRIRLLLLSAHCPWLMQECYAALRYRILWQLFYRKYSVNKAVRMMTAEKLTSSIVHKQNKTQTIFVYFSTSESIVLKIKNKTKSTNHDYTHMLCDFVVSSAISNNFIDSLENEVGNYVEIGPVFADLVNESAKNKETIKKVLGLPVTSILISFFDHTCGHAGVLSSQAYNVFLKSMLELSTKHKDLFFLFKSKHNYDYLQKFAGANSIQLIDSIDSSANCIYANNFSLSQYEVMGVSNLVVSAPLSSVIYESLLGGIKTISYDPLHQYKDLKHFLFNTENILATDHASLEYLIEYWLTDDVDSTSKNYLTEHILPKIDYNFKISTLKRFEKLMESSI